MSDLQTKLEESVNLTLRNGVQEGKMLFFVWREDGEKSALLAEIPESPEEKDGIAKAVRDFMREEDVETYTSVFEAWSLPPGHEDAERIAKEGGSIAEHPDRMEIVFGYGESRDGEKRSVVYSIERNEHGQAVDYHLMDTSEADQFGGRFAGLLAE
jgi:hypothetical protein